jgi:hypothetical protein
MMPSAEDFLNQSPKVNAEAFLQGDAAPETNPVADAVSEIPRQLGLTGRYAVEGLSSLADLPNYVINTVGGAFGANPNLKYPSQMVGEGLTAVGVPEPQNAQERVVGDISRALTGTGATIKGAQALSKYAPMVSELAKNPINQLRAATGASGAAGTTREAGGGQLAQGLAGLAGGMAATKSVLPKKTPYTANEMRAQSNAAYRQAAQQGGALKPQSIVQKLDDIEGKLFSDRVISTSPKYKPVRDQIQFIRNLAKKPISLAEAQSLDSDLGDTISSYIQQNGKPDKVGMMLMKVRDGLRDMIDSADDAQLIGGKQGFNAWKEAKKMWSKSMQLNDVERILERAEGRDNPVTVIKNGFAALKNNPKKFNAFDKDTQAAIKKAAKSGIVSELLRIPGSRLVPIGATITGNPAAVGGAAAAGVATRSARDALQARRALAVSKAIAGTKKTDLEGLKALTLGLPQGINNTQ